MSTIQLKPDATFPNLLPDRTYPATFKTHRTIIDGLPAVVRCCEITDDLGNPTLFSENPTAAWHVPFELLRSKFIVDHRGAKELISDDEFLRLHELFNSCTGLTLNAVQAQAARSILETGNTLVHGETGTGKTFVALFIAWHDSHILGRNVYIVCPRVVVAQWFALLEAHTVSAWVWTMHEYMTTVLTESANDFTVILDEAHVLCGRSPTAWRFARASSAATRKVALTATPQRANRVTDFGIYEWLLGDNSELPLDIQRFFIDRPVERIARHTVQMALADMRNDLPNISFEVVVGNLVLLNPATPAIVFTTTKVVAINQFRTWQRLGTPAAMITGDTRSPEDEVARFTSGAVNRLVMTNSMGVGVSLPRAEIIIFDGIPEGAVNLSQCIGRARRLNSQKPLRVIVNVANECYRLPAQDFINRMNADMNATRIEFPLLTAE